MIKKFNVEKTRQLSKVNRILSLFYKKKSNRLNCELKDVKEILVVDFALIGDMVMNIPFLRNIRANCPDVRITMVGMPWSEDILGSQQLVDEFIIFDGKNILSSPKRVISNIKLITQTLKKINQKTYDIGFEPKGDLRHIMFLHYTHCKRTITYNYTGGEYLVTDSYIPKSDTKHLIDEKLDLLRLSGFEIFSELSIPVLLVDGKYKQMVEEYIRLNQLSNKRIIGIHPGASNNNKQYRYYPELIESMHPFLKAEDVLAIFEGPNEKDIVDNVCKKIETIGISYLRIKKSIKEYVALISICDYMICNDSAAGHIASAYGISTVVIFGPVEPETAIPRGTGRTVFVSKKLDCKPCTLPICPIGTEECIKTIEVCGVLKKLQELDF